MTAEIPKNPWLGLLLFISVCVIVAAIGGIATTPNIPVWYAGLEKPTWTPPNWLFGPVWSMLYLGMAVAAWLVWRKGKAAGPMALFTVQLVLNAAWSWLFFGLHRPDIAFVEILLLWLAIAATTIVFWRRSLAAGLLFLPYLAWVSFAAVLNFMIWQLYV
jgi:translocator protein